MNFRELDIKIKYRSNKKNELIEDFYIPLLSRSKFYRRASGYFSSELLIHISQGISKMIGKNGRIQLVVSPNLNEEDIEAIEYGNDIKKIISDSLKRNLPIIEDKFKKERLNYLAHLIAEGVLEIKIAYFKDNPLALYHEKFGIFEDCFSNKIAFTGSLNETGSGILYNFESISVFCDWEDNKDKVRVEHMLKDFNNLWENKTKGIEVIDCPTAIKNEILKYKKNQYLNEDKLIKKYIQNQKSRNKKEILSIPNNIELREYQKKAIKSWENNNYKGIFKMATGTGKTITSLSSIKKLFDIKGKLFCIIVVPYRHLVEQWNSELNRFNSNGLRVSIDKDWKIKLEKLVHRFNINTINLVFIIITNSSFKRDGFQKIISDVKGEKAIIIDEVHNAGTNSFINKLNDTYKYRLGLSATPDRYFDEIGTNKIVNFFNKVVFEYTLREAIENGFLTRYFYNPIFVYMNDEELSTYIKLSKEASKYIKDTENGIKIDKKGKMLLIKRARLIAGIEDKSIKVKEIFMDRKDSYYNLIYCGATYKDNSNKDNEIKQITRVSKILGNELGMKVKKFTSQETIEERKKIINEFSDGYSLQVIVAIKCLDEGIDIPKIKNAYILSSSANPKEFVQRRGRILRKSQGKSFSYIYDFIALPRNEKEISLANEHILKYDISLIKREIQRIWEFSELAENKYESRKKIKRITDVYKEYFKEDILNGI